MLSGNVFIKQNKFKFTIVGTLKFYGAQADVYKLDSKPMNTEGCSKSALFFSGYFFEVFVVTVNY